MISFDLAGRQSRKDMIYMAVALPIERMSREDKLRAMEALWADLSQDEGKTASPAWHGGELRKAERLVRAGKARFSDWQSASRRIRREAGRPY